MDREFLKKLEKYQKELQTTLENLENERKELLKKVSEGKTLSRKENLRNQDLIEEIDVINDKLSVIKSLNSYGNIRQNFEIIMNDSKPIKEREKACKLLLTSYRKLNEDSREELAILTGLDKSNFTVKNLPKLISNTEAEVADLNAAIKVMTKIGEDVSKLEEDLNDKKELLELLKNYQTSYVSIDELTTDIKTLADSTIDIDKRKQLAEEKYLKNISKLENATIEEIKATIDLTEEESADRSIDSSGDSTPAATSDSSHKSNKIRNAIIGTIISIGSIGALTGCYFLGKNANIDIDDTDLGSKDLPDNKPHIEEQVTNEKQDIIDKLVNHGYSEEFAIMFANELKERDINRILAMPFEKVSTMDGINYVIKTIDKLVEKGYDEYHSTLFVKNFSEETIDEILTIPYYEVITKYANAEGFNVKYLEDYESYKDILNLTNTKVVDYVNRSYKIQATNFYQDASIDDIILVVMSIDNKDLFKSENATEAQSINTAFNRIVENYLFNTTTEDDINKLEAIKYFAKEDSDFGRFLNTFGDLAKNSISNPNSIEARSNLIKFIGIFATSVNGFTNEPSRLTDNQEFNESAQINDYFDWYMAYNSFVGPLATVFSFPKELEGKVDFFYIKEIYNDTRYYMVDEENVTMEDALANVRALREQKLREFGYGNYIDSILGENGLYDVYDLQELMLTALKDPEFKNVCDYGQSLVLGGE